MVNMSSTVHARTEALWRLLHPAIFIWLTISPGTPRKTTNNGSSADALVFAQVIKGQIGVHISFMHLYRQEGKASRSWDITILDETAAQRT
jgi:hypothetical protein